MDFWKAIKKTVQGECEHYQSGGGCAITGDRKCKYFKPGKQGCGYWEGFHLPTKRRIVKAAYFREIREAQGNRVCRVCGKPVRNPRYTRCRPCAEAEESQAAAAWRKERGTLGE